MGVGEGDYEVATCKVSATVEDTLATVQTPSNAAKVGLQVELVPMDGGANRACRGATVFQTGLHAGLYNVWTAQSLDECKALCTGQCKGIEYHAAGKYCEVWKHDIQNSAEFPGSECYARPNKGGNTPASTLSLSSPDAADLGCLISQPTGCMAIQDKLSCISSLDGSNTSFAGIHIRGQPCVWCGGVPCTDGGVYGCAPYSLLSKGTEGDNKAFSSLTAVETTVAECHDPVDFAPEELACLKTAPTGCMAIQDSKECTSSKQGAQYDSIAGFKAKGQPCVWCGGGLCNDGAPNMCEPYDYTMHGEGYAFNDKYNSAVFSRASCDKDNKPAPVELPLEQFTKGTSKRVDCGHPYPLWKKVGQRCGFCKVLVPNIKDEYKTCADYCAHQGGLSCKSAALGSIRSCMVNGEKTCDYAFNAFEHGVCQCDPVKTFEAQNADFAAAVALPAEDQKACLKPVARGCASIQDRQSCLSSIDGSPIDKQYGFKVAGEVCVWCGGVPCTSRHPNVFCEARDLVVNGAGLAFATRGVDASAMVVASCEGGKPAVLAEPETPDLGPPGLHMPVDCGVPYPIWRGVGRQCGFCRVQVAKKAASSYRTCDSYCKAQGGIACEKAFVGSEGDCDTKSTISCSDAISEIDAVCQCAAPKVKESTANLKYAAALPRPSEADMQCLKEAENGCGAIKDKETCLGSLDGGLESLRGLKVRGEPCVWCGGGLCTDHSSSVCGAYDFLANGLGLAFGVRAPSSVSEVATCNKKEPEEDMVLGAAPPVPAVPAAKTAAGPSAECASHAKCAKLEGACCPNAAGVFLDCCNSLAPLAPAPAAAASLQAPPAPTAVVVPHVFVPKELPKLTYMDEMPEHPAQAPRPREVVLGSMAPGWKPPRPPQEELQCMLPEPKGCSAIRHKLMCISRVDGRTGMKDHGFNVGGEPCVWCGGGPCNSASDALCEPYDWLMNGEGKAFDILNAAHWLVAKCQDDRNAVFDDLSCLKRSTIGCNNIHDQGECLASVDARPYEEVAGFKARHQPCVWCGGGSCHSNNDNACEPYDFVMNGAGQAFAYTYAQNTYLVAECEAGHVKPHSYPAAHIERGLPAPVQCGESTKTWDSVGKICGKCDVTVPNINATFVTCEKYCEAHGLQCESSNRAFTHSCEVQTSEYIYNCKHAFEMGDFARCQCSKEASPAAKAGPMLLPAAPYGQCGGKLWKGTTGCQAASHCTVINEWYSQCLPGDLSNPDQAAAAAQVAAQVEGKPIEDQADYAGNAAAKAAAAAGMAVETQATRAYVGSAGTGYKGGLDKQQANAVGSDAAKAAVSGAGVTGDEAEKIAQEAIEDGKVIVFGDETEKNAVAVAAQTASKLAKDNGKSAQEQCSDAYKAAAKMSQVQGDASVAKVAGMWASAEAAKAGLSPKDRVDCVVKAAQAHARESGLKPSKIADAMHDAGIAAGKSTQIPPDQVAGTVSDSMKDTEVGPASKLPIPDELYDKCHSAGQKEAESSEAASQAAMVATQLGKTWGLSAADTGESARKCAYEAAETAKATVIQATAAGEAARSTADSAVTGPSHGVDLKPQPLQHPGKDCWYPCSQRNGLCAYCGIGNACCKRGGTEETAKECEDITTFLTDHHECVVPVHQPADLKDVGDAVAKAVAAAGSSAAGSSATVIVPAGHADAAGVVVAGGTITAGGAAGAASGSGKSSPAAGNADGTVMVPSGHAGAAGVVVAGGTITAGGAAGAASGSGKSSPAAGNADGTVMVPSGHAGSAGMVSEEDAAKILPPTVPPVATSTAPAVDLTTAELVTLAPLTTATTPTTAPTTTPTMPAMTLATTPTTVPMTLATTALPASTSAILQPGGALNTVPPATTLAPATPPPATTANVTLPVASDVVTLPPPIVLGTTGAPEEAILPSPIPPSIKVGLHVAEEEKERKADVTSEAIAAAATTGSYAVGHEHSQDHAKDMATKVATYVFHTDGGQAINEAKISGEQAVKAAMDAEGGKFVTRGRLINQFKDCWEECGKKPGYCDSFCGQGNACCRKTGDSVVPDECTQVYTFYTPHYECIVPSVPYTPASALPAVPRVKAKEGGDETSEVAVTDETVKENPAPSDGFPLWAWILIAFTLVAICVSGIAGWELSKNHESRAGTLKVSRDSQVSEPEGLSPQSAGDLELQAPLVPRPGMAMPAGPVPVAGASLASMPMVPMAPMASYQVAPQAMYQYVPYVAGSSQGVYATGQPATHVATAGAAQAMVSPDFFDRLDANHDGILQRDEWERAVQAGSVAVSYPGGASAALSSRQ